jgi:probable rRNA maturation factor
MAISLTIQNRQRARTINHSRLRRLAINLVTGQLALHSVDVAICLVGDEEMIALNQGYLRHAGSTDVITFDYLERTRSESAAKGEIQGDIFICIPEALRQARRFRTSWQAELVRYLVHGVLHLAGYDDRRAAARRKMKRRENQLVAALADKHSFSELSRARAVSPLAA